MFEIYFINNLIYNIKLNIIPSNNTLEPVSMSNIHIYHNMYLSTITLYTFISGLNANRYLISSLQRLSFIFNLGNFKNKYNH